MHDGTGPSLPGTGPTDPEGSLERPRPALRLIRGRVTPRAAPRLALLRLNAERARRQRLHRSLFGVALASAAGVVVGLFWCAALATLFFQCWLRWR